LYGVIEQLWCPLQANQNFRVSGFVPDWQFPVSLAQSHMSFTKNDF
jgi:hypothetical protein